MTKRIQQALRHRRTTGGPTAFHKHGQLHCTPVPGSWRRISGCRFNILCSRRSANVLNRHSRDVLKRGSDGFVPFFLEVKGQTRQDPLFPPIYVRVFELRLTTVRHL